MKFFRLDSSIHIEGSVTRALADVVEQEWIREFPDAEFVHRDLGLHQLPSVWPDAEARRVAPEDALTDEQRAASALAAELVDELLTSDAYIFAVPMYNFGVPHQVKQWIDMIITDSRACDVNIPLLPGRPAVLVEARGGGYTPGTPREGWNHATPYLERVLGDIWGLDVSLATAELTMAHAYPAMADLRDLAREQLAEAHASAGRHALGIAKGLGQRA
ncbi:FMN-dependent NADH-azoreductase [Embleya sp. NBC_00896]|uniref:FMN-dependent NADH-azoreductase n=1 Tax=Embleya sp. NBC_00896 TaxID=2975961 RepID=UPI00386ABAD4|nr:NAD(P)H-dependent oxidoreductase [Embleya sp. NBC_00896]